MKRIFYAIVKAAASPTLRPAEAAIIRAAVIAAMTALGVKLSH